MTRIAVAVVLVGLACACGRGAGPAPHRSPAGPSSTAAGAAPLPSLGPGGVARPTAGTYTYEVHGEGSTRVPANTRLFENVAASGDVYTSTVTYSTNTLRSQLIRRWEADKVVLLSVHLGNNAPCTFDPPLELLPIPLHAVTLPSQSTGTGECAQTTDITVSGPVQVADAAGHSWTVWQVHRVTHSPTGVTQDETAWFAPQLGVDVRNTHTTSSAAGTTRLTTVLAARP